MNVEIKERNQVLFVKGIINASTVVYFQKTLQSFINKRKLLVLDLDQVTKIDTNGLLALYKFYKNSSIYNMEFKIVGKHCNEIYNELDYCYGV